MIYNEYRVKFYKDIETGRSPALEYIEGLRDKEGSKIFKYIEFLRINEGYLEEPYSKHIKGKIRELRVDFGRNRHRIFYFKSMSKRKINKIEKAVDFQEYLAEKLKNHRFKKYYDEYGKQLEIAYQILKLRKQKHMSQVGLAKKIGTRQSDVARMETGRQNFTTETLQKIASAFKRDLKVEFVK